MNKRLLAAGGFALLVGGIALWATGSQERAVPTGEPAIREEHVPIVTAAPARAPSPRPPAPHAEEVLSDRPTPALVRAGAQPGDDVETRRRLEQQAALAAPYWARLAPKVQDAELRAASTEMFARLNRLDEPAADLAREEYELTQELIAKGGLDRKSQAWLDYLNSTAAAVIQGGNPAEIPTPEQAGQYRPTGK